MCNVRMMLPMSVRCYTCGNYMYIGTKFNMKVETVKDEDYLGIKIYRFYFKCTQCYSEVTFRTDPKNHDYIAEWGASRNHEPWKDMLMAEEEYKEMKQNEMKEDAMKSLEHRTYDSKREMDILDALDQVKSLNRRQASINYQEMIDKVIYQEQQKELDVLEEKIEDEANKKYETIKIKRIDDYNNFEEININILNKKTNRENNSEQNVDENKNISNFSEKENGINNNANDKDNDLNEEEFREIMRKNKIKYILPEKYSDEESPSDEYLSEDNLDSKKNPFNFTCKNIKLKITKNESKNKSSKFLIDKNKFNFPQKINLIKNPLINNNGISTIKNLISIKNTKPNDNKLKKNGLTSLLSNYDTNDLCD